MQDFDEQELWDIMYNGVAEVECAECGYCATIEPDGDYDCPECEEGRLVSPMVELGVI